MQHMKNCRRKKGPQAGEEDIRTPGLSTSCLISQVLKLINMLRLFFKHLLDPTSPTFLSSLLPLETELPETEADVSFSTVPLTFTQDCWLSLAVGSRAVAPQWPVLLLSLHPLRSLHCRPPFCTLLCLSSLAPFLTTIPTPPHPCCL